MKGVSFFMIPSCLMQQPAIVCNEFCRLIPLFYEVKTYFYLYLSCDIMNRR